MMSNSSLTITVKNQLNLYINTKIKNYLSSNNNQDDNSSSAYQLSSLPTSIAQLFASESTRSLAYLTAIKSTGANINTTVTTTAAQGSSGGNTTMQNSSAILQQQQQQYSGVVSDRELFIAALFNFTLRSFPPPLVYSNNKNDAAAITMLLGNNNSIEQQHPQNNNNKTNKSSTSSVPSHFNNVNTNLCLCAILNFAQKHTGIGAPSEFKQLAAVSSILLNKNDLISSNSSHLNNNNNNPDKNNNNSINNSMMVADAFDRLPPIDPHLDIGGGGGGAESSKRGLLSNNNDLLTNEGSNSGYDNNGDGINGESSSNNLLGGGGKRPSSSAFAQQPPKISTMLSILAPVGLSIAIGGTTTTVTSSSSAPNSAGSSSLTGLHHHHHHLNSKQQQQQQNTNTTSTTSGGKHHQSSAGSNNSLRQQSPTATSNNNNTTTHHTTTTTTSATNMNAIPTTRSRNNLQVVDTVAGLQYFDDVIKKNAKLRNSEFEGAWKYTLRPRLLKDYVASSGDNTSSTTTTTGTGASGNNVKLRYSKERFSNEMATLFGQSSNNSNMNNNNNKNHQTSDSDYSANGAYNPNFSSNPKVQSQGAIAVMVKTTIDGFISKLPFAMHQLQQHEQQQQQQQRQFGDDMNDNNNSNNNQQLQHPVTILREVSEGLLHVLSAMLLRSEEYSVRARSFEVLLNLTIHIQLLDSHSISGPKTMRLVLGEVEWMLTQLLETMTNHVIMVSCSSSSSPQQHQNHHHQSSSFMMPSLQLDATSVRLLIAALKATLLIVPSSSSRNNNHNNKSQNNTSSSSDLVLSNTSSFARVVPMRTIALFSQLPVVENCSTSVFDSLCSAVLERIIGKSFDDFFTITTVINYFHTPNRSRGGNNSNNINNNKSEERGPDVAESATTTNNPNNNNNSTSDQFEPEDGISSPSFQRRNNTSSSNNILNDTTTSNNNNNDQNENTMMNNGNGNDQHQQNSKRRSNYTTTTSTDSLIEVTFSFADFEAYGGTLGVVDQLVNAPTNGSAASLFVILYCSYYAAKLMTNNNNNNKKTSSSPSSSSSCSFSLELKPIQDALRLGLHWHCRYLLCSQSEGVRAAVHLRQILGMDLDSDTRVSLTNFIIDLIMGTASCKANAAFLSSFSPAEHSLITSPPACSPELMRLELGDTRHLASLLDDSDATVFDMACRMTASGLYHEWISTASSSNNNNNNMNSSSNSKQQQLSASLPSITSALLNVLSRLQSTRVRTAIVKIIKLLVIIIRSRATTASHQKVTTSRSSTNANANNNTKGARGGKSTTTSTAYINENDSLNHGMTGLAAAIIAGRSFSSFLQQCLDIITVMRNTSNSSSSSSNNNNTTNNNRRNGMNNNNNNNNRVYYTLPPSLPLICGITRTVLESCIAQSEKPFFEFGSNLKIVNGDTTDNHSNTSQQDDQNDKDSILLLQKDLTRNGSSFSIQQQQSTGTMRMSDDQIFSSISETFQQEILLGAENNSNNNNGMLQPPPLSLTPNDDFISMFEKSNFTISLTLLESIGGSATLWRMYRGLRFADETSTTILNQTCCRLRYFILRILVCLIERNTSSITVTVNRGNNNANNTNNNAGTDNNNNSTSVDINNNNTSNGLVNNGNETPQVNNNIDNNSSRVVSPATAAEPTSILSNDSISITSPTSPAGGNINGGRGGGGAAATTTITLTTTSDIPFWKMATSDPNSHCSALVCSQIVKAISEPFELENSGHQPPYVLANQLLNSRMPQK